MEQIECAGVRMCGQGRARESGKRGLRERGVEEGRVGGRAVAELSRRRGQMKRSRKRRR